MFKKPYKAICFHSFLLGNRNLKITCATNNNIIEAIKNLNSANTNGCTFASPIFVAVDAEDHKKEKSNPAEIHLNCGLFIFSFIKNILKINI